MKLICRKQPGQSLVILAAFALTICILMGVGIDSGMLYNERRQLQNASDAACLAAATDLGMGQSIATAKITAGTYVTSNLNANAALAFVSTPSISPTISGQNDVRIVLNASASTYFMRALGTPFNTYNIMAHTHCNSTSGGSNFLPVAVIRFPGGNTMYSLGDPNHPQGTIIDVLQQGSGILNQGTGAPATMTGCGTPDDPNRNWYDWNGSNQDNATNHTGSYNDACTAASLANPGPEVAMYGVGAKANNSSSFRGIVALDARQMGTTPIYYNALVGHTGSLNNSKAAIIQYIDTQYPGPDVQIGDQLGIIDGNTSGPVKAAMNARWNVGDIVTTLVYDGTVQSNASNSWVNVLCYARFKLTYIDPNEFGGQAVSGCIDPKTAPQKLPSTSRLLPW